jgi:hypothetical protein
MPTTRWYGYVNGIADLGACPDCGTIIVTGQVITLSGGRWRHVDCLSGKVPMIGPPTGQ